MENIIYTASLFKSTERKCALLTQCRCFS